MKFTALTHSFPYPRFLHPPTVKELNSPHPRVPEEDKFKKADAFTSKCWKPSSTKPPSGERVEGTKASTPNKNGASTQTSKA